MKTMLSIPSTISRLASVSSAIAFSEVKSSVDRRPPGTHGLQERAQHRERALGVVAIRTVPAAGEALEAHPFGRDRGGDVRLIVDRTDGVVLAAQSPVSGTGSSRDPGADRSVWSSPPPKAYMTSKFQTVRALASGSRGVRE